MQTVALSLLLALQTAPADDAVATQTAVAEGDRLLAAADAADLFANESATAGGAIILRHKASGYRCVLNPGRAVNAVHVYPGLPRGDDVGCSTQTISDIRTLYLTRSTGTTAQEAASATLAIQARYQGARPADLSGNRSMFELPGRTIPEHKTVGFETPNSYEQVTVGIVNGWAVKYRFSSPPGTAGRSGVFDSFWITTVLEPELAARKAAQANAATEPNAIGRNSD
ncbi:hypothetical protein [Brevundimonas sp. SORGH_AS_0993]|uniref:hypothetical protein n=1 Tax=Brevundimonas sp. SORGH_AS_0993 TaxID=3041794 RepID=UPI00278674C1|nr:hypothetical protein [Brevundimonas sp. SORGH_AS_0993]MDQ1154084.1 hypothetical protein [Brevundimonas sp. SORGH_AS_0993]